MILKLKWAAWYGVLTVTAAAANPTFAEQELQDYRHYHVDAKVISLDATQSLTSYRVHGAGSGTPGATLGYATPDANVNIELLVDSDRFCADVTINRRGASDEKDANKQPIDLSNKHRIDLSNLRPTFLDFGTDKEGRTYQLNLTPSVVSVRLAPKPFQEAADDMYSLKFHASRIMLNDEQYIGRMLASDADIFSIEVCGTASVEFSLRHLKDAKPWGRLQDGQITLRHPDGTSIEIGNVTNGPDERLITGGPYTVWVRWGNARQTVEEYRAALSAHRDRLKSGDIGGDGALAAIDRELARKPGPWVTSCSARSARRDEIVRDE